MKMRVMEWIGIVLLRELIKYFQICVFACVRMPVFVFIYFVVHCVVYTNVTRVREYLQNNDNLLK